MKGPTASRNARGGCGFPDDLEKVRSSCIKIDQGEDFGRDPRLSGLSGLQGRARRVPRRPVRCAASASRHGGAPVRHRKLGTPYRLWAGFLQFASVLRCEIMLMLRGALCPHQLVPGTKATERVPRPVHGGYKKGRGKSQELDPLKLPTRLQTALQAFTVMCNDLYQIIATTLYNRL